MNTGLLSKDQKRSGRQWYRHTEVTRDSGTGIQKWLLPCGALAFNVPIDSDLKLWLRSLPCGLTGSWIHSGWRAPMTAGGNSTSIASYKKKKKERKERGKLVTLSLTLRSPKGETAMSMWMERTRLAPTGWGECSESALCRHWYSLNPTPLSFSTWLYPAPSTAFTSFLFALHIMLFHFKGH